MPSPTYPRNGDGLTYGSAADATSPANEPDLILVVMDDGNEGYVKKVELDEANGAAAVATFKSPEEALTWQEACRNAPAPVVPVYAVDGRTVIGTFTLDNSQEPPAGLFE